MFRIPNPWSSLVMSHRSTSARRSRTALALSLLGAGVLLTGCGSGDQLPAGSMGLSSNSSALTNTDDPVMAGYDGIDSVDSSSADSVFGGTGDDFGDGGSALMDAGMDVGLDDPMLDGGLDPVGYGGYDDGYGYGGNGGYGYGRNSGYGNGWGSALGLSGLNTGYGGVGMAGLGGVGMAGLGGYGTGGMAIDDPGVVGFGSDIFGDDLGGSIADPSVGFGAADTSIDDGGQYDFSGGFDTSIGGFDPGFDVGSSVDSGFDVGGPADFGGGFDVGGADMAPVEMGGAVGGFDPGVGAVDVGGFDVGAGAGGFDVGGMDAGVVF